MKLLKNIGFIEYPGLGMPSPYSGVMEVEPDQVQDRYAIADQEGNAGGANLFNLNTNPDKGLPDKQQKFSGFIDINNRFDLKGNQDHEAQHSIFTKLKQQHGTDFVHRLIDQTMSVLKPHERKIIDHININKNKYLENKPEETIAHFHNYLQDPGYRNLVHEALNLSPKGARNLHSIAKSSWRKMREHAKNISLDDIKKSEDLAKRTPPVFPKLGIPDNRKETELINDPKSLYTKLRTMGHAGAKKAYEQGHYQHDPETNQTKKVPAAHETKQYHQRMAAKEANQMHYAAKQHTTSTSGAVQGHLGYALSGILRPDNWSHPIENESQGTKQHEDFHAQMNRIESKFGKYGRHALVDNLWNALPEKQRNLINYLQDFWAGDYYDKRNPSQATEEKLARLLNHLNSPTTRQRFHAQFLKTHKLPNGDVAKAGVYYIPGERELYDRGTFDNELKNAHRNLLAAGETANENWLKPGHTNSDYLRPPPGMVKSEANSDYLDDMHGYSHRLQVMCQAARFLSKRPTDESVLRDCIRTYDGDMQSAVLAAHGLNPTDTNIKALNGISKVQDLHKSLFDTYKIAPAHPEAEGIAKELQEAADLGHIQNVKLGGKHSNGSLLIDTENNGYYILKPGSGASSPVKGVSQEQATQSEREVAFSKIAKALGIHSIPDADLVLVNGKQYAAIKAVPFSYRNIETIKLQEEPNIGRIAFEPYRQSGELWKWAALDVILGNGDSHGGNVMVSPADEDRKVVLIDHGSAFAGTEFSPGTDSNSFVPYYLRAFTDRPWDKLNKEQKLNSMPRLTPDKEKLVHDWVMGINPDTLGTIMQRYGINAQPSLSRLEALKNTKEPVDIAIANMWL